MTAPYILDAARTWHNHGATPVPVSVDGSKRPAGTWRHLTEKQPAWDDVEQAFARDTDGLGIICGASSGGLEMLEAEGRAVAEGVVAAYAQLLTDHGLGDLWARLNGGYVETSPSGGIHWYYRVDGAPAKANTKLASRPATAEELVDNPRERVKVLIETRGQGGFTVVAPSAGRSHPTGQPWAVLTGTVPSIPTLTSDERDALYAIATMLDTSPPVEADTPAGRSGASAGGRPGDDYNSRTSWDELLVPDGWTKARALGQVRCWVRPGKDARDGISATTGRNEADNLYVFTTSTDLPVEQPISKFGYYALTRHGGDYSAAAKQLRKDGYGDTLKLAPDPDVTEVERIDATGTDGATVVAMRPVEASRVGERYGPTEDGTARALVHLHSDRLRYCPQRGQWLVWAGSRWVWDVAERHRELIRAIARDLPDEKGWATYKRRALSAAGVSGIERHARSDEHLTVHIDQLDARPFELNTPGGIVNLSTGNLSAPDPSALHTRSTAVTPDFDRASDLLGSFLSTTFGGDQQLVTYVQQLLGLAALGRVVEQILPFGFGAGANGKSTLLDACMYTLGRGDEGYAISAPAEMLMVRKYSEHPAEIAQLAGARLVVCSELEEGARFAEARVKLLTGGDSINARFMRRDPFTFTPSHTLFLLGNSKPQAATGGQAFYRRLRLIPFEHVVPEADRDPRLLEKLEADAPALLAWIVRGAASYLAAGALMTPEHVRAATDEYASEQDTVGRFVEERCLLSPTARITVRELRAAYETWCAEVGEVPASPKRFAQDVIAHGAEAYRAQGVRRYRGIELYGSDEGDETDGRESAYGDLGGGSW